MRIQIFVFLIFFASLCTGLPVTKQKPDEKPPEPSIDNASEVKDILEYERYLNEVIQALETDAEFKKKLDKAPEADIRNGKIAQELDYVNHNVRTKLHEIKRREIERLRHFASKQYELTNHIDREHLKIPQHLDHENEHTFEIEDLRKLILKTSEDLAEADRKRREDFKNYEMQKEFETQQKMKAMDEQHRIQYEKELAEKKKKHSQHEKVHHPGSKAQLEEVWEKQDEMDRNDFDPKVFFKIHDLDGNGFWDETEVKTLFIKELDKVYQAGVPEDDMRERAEEMENMREHVFKETDTNRDNLISYDEFLNQTRTQEFNRDPGWDTIDNSTPFSQYEYKQFEMQREEEIQRLIEQGKLPPKPVMHDGYYNYEVHPGYVQHDGQYVPPEHISNQHPPIYNDIHRDAIQQQQQQQQQYAQGGHYSQQQAQMPQYQNPQVHPSYQQQVPQYLPQQAPVEHVPHQQVHVPQQQPQGSFPHQQQQQQVQQHQQQQIPQHQQQQIPQHQQQQQQIPQHQQQQQQIPQHQQQQQQIPQHQQQQQQIPQHQQQQIPQQQQQQIPQQQQPQQQYIPQQQIQQPQQVAQPNVASPQQAVSQQQQQQQQPNVIQQQNIQVPPAAQPVAAGQNNIPQIKTNHV